MPSFVWKSNHRRSVALAGFLTLPLLVCACPKNDPPPINPRITISRKGVPKSQPLPTSFNGERAMAHVRKQVEIGPRPPDTPALAKTRSYIIVELKSYGFNVTSDEFIAATPLGEKRMTNIVAEIPGETNKLILIASHYETKLYDDMHFVGANDPGASVGTLLEIGRVLAAANGKPKVTYRLVFFDGEEALCEGWSECEKPDAPDNTYGSRHYVAQLRARNELENTRALILLDMVGYKKLELGRDTLSTRWLQDIIWQTGRELGHNKIFVDRPEGVGGDDHEPFLKAGVPSVDLIQLNGYPYWHRPDDTIDKVSAQSMKIVGDTVIASLPRIVAHVTK
jgi:glutaminyl-peptide cyclotransferase